MRRKRKKALILLIVLPICFIIVSVFGLASCSKDKDENQRESVSNVFPDDAPQTIVDVSSVPVLFQFDERWKDIPYGTSTVGVAGCAPTCLAMVFSWLLQDSSLTPDIVSKWSEDNGLYEDGVGSSNLLMEAFAEAKDVFVEGIFRSKDHLADALTAGKKVIANVGPGTFTSTGHFIVLTDYLDGQVKVNDPNSQERSTWWPIETIIREGQYLWAYS